MNYRHKLTLLFLEVSLYPTPENIQELRKHIEKLVIKGQPIPESVERPKNLSQMLESPGDYVWHLMQVVYELENPA